MSITVKGADKLLTSLRQKADPTKVRRVVKENGAELQQTMQRNANFTKGYETQTTKRSINLAITDGGLTAKVEPTTDYSPYLEYGTRFMDAQPFVGPSYHKQKNVFMNDLKKLVK